MKYRVSNIKGSIDGVGHVAPKLAIVIRQCRLLHGQAGMAVQLAAVARRSMAAAVSSSGGQLLNCADGVRCLLANG